MPEYLKPVPTMSADTKPFWEGCKRHELLLQWCRDCQKYQFFPRAICSHCWGQDLEWRKSSGRGKVYTYTVVHQNKAPGFRDEVPYVLAYVELEEEVRLLTNIVGCGPQEVRIDMPVEVVFEDATPTVSIPKFRPRGA